MEINYLKQTRLIHLAAYASVFVAGFIVIIKLYAWHVTHSLSLLSSLIDSLLDIFSSSLNLVAVRYALRPADADHRFGHGKAEDLAALAQSVFIAASALVVIKQGIDRWLNPVAIESHSVGIWVMVISMILSIGLVAYQQYVVKKTRSNVIKADALHYQVDALVNIVVIISLIGSVQLHNPAIDVIVAFLIAAYILYGSFGIGKKAFDHLMDKEFSDEKRTHIINLALSHPMVLGVHDLRTRNSGVKPIIQLHLELDGKISLNEAHQISEEVEARIMEVFPQAEILVHQDPINSKVHPPQKGQVLSIHSKR